MFFGYFIATYTNEAMTNKVTVKPDPPSTWLYFYDFDDTTGANVVNSLAIVDPDVLLRFRATAPSTNDDDVYLQAIASASRCVDMACARTNDAGHLARTLNVGFQQFPKLAQLCVSSLHSILAL